MAQILCNKSGILFNCEFLPFSLSSGELSHPFFSIPQKKLLNLTRDWALGKLSIEQSYLLYLSLLDSTDLIEWSSQTEFTPKTPGILAANMENLILCIGKINVITHPSFKLPRFHITRDTRTLSNSHHWIEIWTDNCNEWVQSQKNQRDRAALESKIEIREHALNKILRSAYAANPAKISAFFAEWAALVGEFPEFDTLHPRSKRPIPIAEYWKAIIRAAHDEDKLWQFPRSDIVELIEHCHEHIRNEDIRSHELFKLLNQGLLKYDDYAGLANFEIYSTPGKTPFKMLSDEESTYQATLKTIADAAPVDEPKRESYANHFAWMKAHMQWKIKNQK